MTENKLDKEVKEEKNYRTSDNKLFTGKGALIKANKHQKVINKENKVLTFSKEARKFFDLPEEISDSNEDIEDEGEQSLINTINRELGSFDYFEEFFECMVKLYSRYPAIFDMFKLIDTEFKKGA